MLTAYNAQELIQQRDSKCRLRVLGDCASKDVHSYRLWETVFTSGGLTLESTVPSDVFSCC